MNPVEQVEGWLAEAKTAGLPGYDTAIVATASPDGRPSARAVILRGLDRRGFVFYSDTRSRKGGELSANPRAALVLVWDELQRQVRVEGPVEGLAPEESDRYFAGRPRGHQLGAWASRQSQPLANREELEARLVEVVEEFSGRPVPRPPYWGGYRIVPEEIELWQGLPDRLHHRIRYRRGSDPDEWVGQLLWP
ncbi:MAG: pyridoxamine 5'-phosphate oxidase [Acidimicrobiales bacterium]|nr:pyridoxamine 5'-phosphate oxidase [Actinomycetota bacterium]